ncbi:Nucleolar protein 16 [Caenorhabditis elegans]|uniref:Nucleolar protein 16 n=1 Tax=Caenorhabditis elegans TaxID=6239 RepID=A0A4V0IJF1_CAEEL|nr:Nucleolar protein 16 [Caenorhabditis elegans]VTW47593.1 Nucleolar protein 16 [Caenorhabditis elegans]
MRSPKSVRRPHIRQQLTNRRKNLGRVAKSQRNQFRQWLLTAVLPNSINDQRKEAFASLELTEQPQQVEKVKKSEKKKAQKQIAKDHEAEQKVNAKKAAEKEARRAEAEAKKRAAQEEEHKQWKAEQERIQKEQEKKEADLKKLQAEKKKEKAVKAEKAEKAEKTKKASTPAPVEEEIVVKKVANDRSAAPAPEPKTPTNTPAEPAEQVQEITGKKNKKNKKKSESEATAAPASVEQVVEQPKVVTEEPHQQAAPQEKKNKKNKRKSESENVPAASETPVEPVVEKVEKPVAPVSKKPTADDNMDFLDFVTAKPEKTESVEEHIEAPMIVEPVHAENETAAAAGGKKKNKKNKNKKNSESESTPAAEPVKEVTPEIVEEVFEKKTITPSTAAAAAPAPGSKKNKKNKKNSESESAPAAEPVKEVTPEIVEEVFEKKTVTPSTEAAAAPASASKKNKKNKKGSGISESHDTAPAPTVEIPQTTEGGKGSPGSDKENSGSAVNGSAKKQMSVEELDYGVPGQTTDTTTDKKNKKKNKKGKNSNSISENAQVIAHLEQDHLDQMADDEVQAITGAAGSHSPPIQVHEVTSSEQHSNGVEKNTTIEITQAVDGTDMSQTQFQKNVEKLVQATLAKHDIVEIDPTVKLRIDAQLIKLSEKKAPAVVMEHVNYIKPLPMELHVSRPSTPSRDRVYKLLPKDIIFCAGLMDSHGENYAAMAADERNIFKDTSRALQRKIRIFKESPHYHTYLRAKEENRPIEEVIAEAQH